MPQLTPVALLASDSVGIFANNIKSGLAPFTFPNKPDKADAISIETVAQDFVDMSTALAFYQENPYVVVYP